MREHRFLLVLICLMLGAMAVLGIVLDGLSAFSGLWSLQISPARLLSDFMHTHGPGAALLNAVLVATLGLILFLLNGVKLSGASFAVVLTLLGFGLFGKTPMNALPIILGTAIAARIAERSFREYIIIALFGTAMGPVVSLVVTELGLIGLPALLTGLGAGIVVGVLLPALAVSMLHLHQGYNLYNIGLTAGFLALFFAAVIRGFGHEVESVESWYTVFRWLLVLIVPVIAVLLTVFALLYGKGKAFSSWLKIQKMTGRLPSDFVDMADLSGALLNSASLAAVGSFLVFATGNTFNGPVIGALLTMVGFGAFGSTLRNYLPVLAGALVATQFFGLPLNTPSVILALIFCSTLGPLAGAFGVPVGFAAGFLHLSLVMQTSIWHGGINLYNNGFAGGLVAALFVSIIQWYRSNRDSFVNRRAKE